MAIVCDDFFLEESPAPEAPAIAPRDRGMTALRED